MIKRESDTYNNDMILYMVYS